MILRSKHIILEHGEFDGYLELENGRICRLLNEYSGPYRDFSDQLVFPGFIDIHVHGWATGSFWFEKTADAIREMSRTLPMAGVTSYLATSGDQEVHRRRGPGLGGRLSWGPDDGSTSGRPLYQSPVPGDAERRVLHRTQPGGDGGTL